VEHTLEQRFISNSKQVTDCCNVSRTVTISLGGATLDDLSQCAYYKRDFLSEDQDKDEVTLQLLTSRLVVRLCSHIGSLRRHLHTTGNVRNLRAGAELHPEMQTNSRKYITNISSGSNSDSGSFHCSCPPLIITVVGLDWIEQGLTSHSTHFRSFRRRSGGCGISQNCSRSQSPQCVRC